MGYAELDVDRARWCRARMEIRTCLVCGCAADAECKPRLDVCTTVPDFRISVVSSGSARVGPKRQSMTAATAIPTAGQLW